MVNSGDKVFTLATIFYKKYKLHFVFVPQEAESEGKKSIQAKGTVLYKQT